MLTGLSALAAFAASCQYPAWVYQEPTARRTAPLELPPPDLKPEPPSERGVAAPLPADRVVVAPGDTLYAIARRNDVALRDLIEINRLRPPYTLMVGQLLTLPQARYHTVAEADTVYGISRRYGVDMSALVRLNGVQPPYTLRVGQRLRLPASTWHRAMATSSPQEAGAVVETAATSATTERGEPPRDGSKASALSLAPPPPRTGTGFDWPADGEIISRFGPKPGNLHNDGINIALSQGAPVRAAENGVVAYVGNELRGYGNLILIRHEGGWVTAYAHNDALLVRRGDVVRRGQVVALAGKSGNVATPQLHFELRHDGMAIDPVKHLSKG